MTNIYILRMRSSTSKKFRGKGHRLGSVYEKELEDKLSKTLDSAFLLINLLINTRNWKKI